MGSKEKRQERAREKRKELARAKQAKTDDAKKPPNRIFYRLPPDALGVVGPVIIATWSVPKALADALAASGRAVPAPIVGLLLIDTGAGPTCISESAAQRLGLQPVRIAPTYGASGLGSNNVYEAQLSIEIADQDRGVNSRLDLQMQVTGVKDLEKQFQGLQIGGIERQLVGLLGRDLLRNMTLTYKGTGSFELLLDLDAFTKPVKPTT